jgi:hypothetical protein
MVVYRKHTSGIQREGRTMTTNELKPGSRVVPEGNAFLDDLEGWIDRRGLQWVLDALAGVCQEKADHLRTNWQGARSWERCARAIQGAEKTAGEEGL